MPVLISDPVVEPYLSFFSRFLFGTLSYRNHSHDYGIHLQHVIIILVWILSEITKILMLNTV